MTHESVPTMPENPNEKPWYHEGLKFTCTQCGDCCTGAEGYVWVTDQESKAIAKRLDLPIDDFYNRHTRIVDGERSLLEKENGDCVFWSKGIGCTIYEDRPIQCRTWPFWRSNIETKRHWRSTLRICPGSGQGRLYTAQEILARSKMIDL